ncbi:hypothetical protein [Mycobacteroides salmoniphilum]|uniref:hypothetical protein n=1 Tax=Mycobacteroides salmoniphilum TaxID=404941 RepID=UPI0009940BC9|nr:hypothetical protein [Mycobacteroides salmoniphilum]QCH23785.1 hypothetical protein DSM43276_02046 [Mycobacteroides salmoniphilum]
MPKRKIIVTAAGVAGALALAGLSAPMAAADPPGIPFVPGVPGPLPATPGSYWYMYNNFYSPSPATVDARGVKISSNSDLAATASGLPGSKLGNSAHPANLLTGASTRNGIQGGETPAAPASTTGVQFAAGNENGLVEDPYGRPPAEAAPAAAEPPSVASVPSSVEAAAPESMFPGAPASPVLESPDGKPVGSEPAAG